MPLVWVARASGDKPLPLSLESLDGVTVRTVLQKAQMPFHGGEIVLIKGKRVDVDCPVQDQDRIVVSEAIEGG